MGAVKNINTFIDTIRDQNKRLPEYLKSSMHKRDQFEQLFDHIQSREGYAPQVHGDEPRPGSIAFAMPSKDGFLENQFEI